MKNYLIAILVLLIIVLSSFLYKESQGRVFAEFPILESKEKNNVDKPLNIFIFFSANNCPSCLAVIPVLNKLPKNQFRVIGVVSEKDHINEGELRKKTKASFELIITKKYKKFIPHYWPTIMGVGQRGNIYFILPSVPGVNEYLEEFLQTFYYNIYERIRD